MLVLVVVRGLQVRRQYPSEPVAFTDEPLVLHWPEAMTMLRDDGLEVRGGTISRQTRAHAHAHAQRAGLSRVLVPIWE